ncbi:zinc ribbon domain-containing protein [Agathobaculum sp.]|uniref:zinc ribbon domain-containing protein n=1 Tax=Agathobaculum sp. TaxID=2048138 RepID=UPI003AF108DB
MKCQHCGINFDDGEKTCPVCGARAGSRGRLSEPRKFPFQPKTVRPKAKERTEYESVQSEIDPEYESVRTTAQHQSHSHEAQPLGRKARPSAKPIRENRVKGSRTAAIVVAAIVFLLNIAPAFIGLIEDSTANFPERIPDFIYDFTDGDSSYDDDNADTYIDLSILVGEQIELPLSDGATLALYFEPGEDGAYTLGYIAPDGSKQYVEQGYSSCSEESDSWYDEENFPTEDYEFYLTWMTKNEEAASNTTVPPWYDARGESDIWLCIYRSRTDGSIILQDMDRLGLFGDTDIYELNPTALI